MAHVGTARDTATCLSCEWEQEGVWALEEAQAHKTETPRHQMRLVVAISKGKDDD